MPSLEEIFVAYMQSDINPDSSGSFERGGEAMSVNIEIGSRPSDLGAKPGGLARILAYRLERISHDAWVLDRDGGISRIWGVCRR